MITGFDPESARRIASAVRKVEGMSQSAPAFGAVPTSAPGGALVRTPTSLPGNYDGTQPVLGRLIERSRTGAEVDLGPAWIQGFNAERLAQDKVYTGRQERPYTSDGTTALLFRVQSTGATNPDVQYETVVPWRYMKIYAEKGDEWSRDWSMDALVYVRASAYFYGYSYTDPQTGLSAPDISRIKLPGDPFLDQYAENNMDLYTTFQSYDGYADWPLPFTFSSNTFGFQGRVGMDDFAAVCWYNAFSPSYLPFSIKLTHLWGKSKSVYVKGYNNQKIYIKTNAPPEYYGTLAGQPYGEYHFNNVVDTVKYQYFNQFQNIGDQVRVYPYGGSRGGAFNFRFWYWDYFNLLRKDPSINQLVLVQQFRSGAGGYYGITQVRHTTSPNSPTQTTTNPAPATSLGLPFGQQSFGLAEIPAPLSFPPSPADLYTVNQPGSGSTVGTSPGGFDTGTFGEA